jgi:hypothetical protein
MFANNEITGRGFLHRALERANDEVTLDERLVWAHSIDRSIKDAANPAIPFRSRVAWPGVVLGAAPVLVAVAAILRDEDVAVSREGLDAVHAYLTDGIDSPLFGSDPLAARRGAEQLRRELAGTQVAQRATAGAAT